MKLAIIVACAGIIGVAGCGTALNERAPTTGSLASRTLALQESLFAIMERSDKPEQAAAGIRKYCDKHQNAIQQLTIDAGALGSDPAALEAFTTDFTAGLKELTLRSADALKGKESMIDSPLIMGAIERCNVGAAAEDDGGLDFVPDEATEPAADDADTGDGAE